MKSFETFYATLGDTHGNYAHIFLNGGLHNLRRSLPETSTTSIPASIKAEATTLTPLSWPSRPGFATNILILFFYPLAV